VVSHCPTHLLIVHFFTSIQLHSAPRSCNNLEDAVNDIDPTDDLGVVGPVVQQVPDEGVERRKRNFWCMLSGTTPFTLYSTFGFKSGQRSCKKSITYENQMNDKDALYFINN